MGLLKIIILIVLLNVLLFSGYYLYENYLSSDMNRFVAQINGLDQERLVNISSEVSQFYPKMRFNHNDLSYYFNEECDSNKEYRMKQAFSIITVQTNNLITFYPTSEEKADILIGCSPNSYEKEENIFVGGEGGPTRIINSSFSVITKGKVLLYNESRSICDEPILELHELLHVFGYDHINDSSKIMHPYLNCKQELNSDLVDHLIEIYSIKPFADLSFEEVNANRERSLGRWYLNFNVSINNRGIINAEKSVLEISSKDELIEEFDLKTLEFGGGKNFNVNNLIIPSSAEEITFSLKTNTFDSNLDNNIVELKIQ